MGFYSDFMGFHVFFFRDLMGFYRDLMGYEWDVPSGKLLHFVVENDHFIIVSFPIQKWKKKIPCDVNVYQRVYQNISIINVYDICITCPSYYWLVVSTPLKNIGQLALSFPIYGKISQSCSSHYQHHYVHHYKSTKLIHH